MDYAVCREYKNHYLVFRAFFKGITLMSIAGAIVAVTCGTVQNSPFSNARANTSFSFTVAVDAWHKKFELIFWVTTNK